MAQCKNLIIPGLADDFDRTTTSPRKLHIRLFWKKYLVVKNVKREVKKKFTCVGKMT